MPQPTPAQRQGAHDAAQGRPPLHEGEPLSPAEQRQVERAQERQLNQERER
jgi:hypothetical protein